MQLSLALDPQPILPAIRGRLLDCYGPQRDTARLDPVSQLVLAILSCRTRDPVALAVFERLRLRYGSWTRLARADPDAIEAIIRPVTYAESKADQIPRALRMIEARTGRLDLGFLADWPVEQALAWLVELPGCGLRNAAAVVSFSSLRKRALSVDTHHLRIAKRFGWVPATADYDAGYHALMRLAPDAWDADDLYELHWLMKHHGQRVCTHRAPDCRRCPLRDLCSRCGVGV